MHGCALELAQLLVKLKYDKNRDRLVFVGDLVNKGPDSLKVCIPIMPARSNYLEIGSLQTITTETKLHCFSLALQLRQSHPHASNIMCLQVMRLVMTAGAAVVRGNHDDSALSAYNKLQKPETTIQVLLLPSAQTVLLSTVDTARNTTFCKMFFALFCPASVVNMSCLWLMCVLVLSTWLAGELAL